MNPGQRCLPTGNRERVAYVSHPHLRVDVAAARNVADHYLNVDARTDRSLVRAAYHQLVTQTDHQLRRLLRVWSPDPPRLVTTALTTPYDSEVELARAVRESNVLEIPAVDRERHHPILSCDPGGEYDRFRALHDLVGHVLAGFGFDRDGEFSAWHAQDRYYRGLARWALATELHAQHSVLWTTGELAEPKAMLIDQRLLKASRAAAPGDVASGAVTDRSAALSYAASPTDRRTR
jgi:hypothetical protein